MTDTTTTVQTPIRQLSKSQRRVLGVLIEKGITTPEYYPLTLKAVTTGANQKNNRDPISNYTEDAVEETLEELRELGLVAVVHTETGRTQRYRHYMRHRFTLTEPQLAILTELMLRGKQQLGELRTRASRMAPIESQDQLRSELKGLLELKLVQADGPFERRGTLVDHNLYLEKEGQRLVYQHASDDAAEEGTLEEADDERDAPSVSYQPRERSGTGGATANSSRYDELNALCQRLSDQNRQLESDVDSLRTQMQDLAQIVDDLRRQLGG